MSALPEFEKLHPVYAGEPVLPEPPYSDEDPFAHQAMDDASRYAREHNPPLAMGETYDLALSHWLADAPVKPGRTAEVEEQPFFRVRGSEKHGVVGTVMDSDTCPVCGAPADQMPGCYIPYVGRRWDCTEMYGRNLTGPERAAMVEHQRAEPQCDFGAINNILSEELKASR